MEWRTAAAELWIRVINAYNIHWKGQNPSVTGFRHNNPGTGYDRKQDLQIKNPYENKVSCWYEGYESSNTI